MRADSHRSRSKSRSLNELSGASSAILRGYGWRCHSCDR
jgi:hypothetical protein